MTTDTKQSRTPNRTKSIRVRWLILTAVLLLPTALLALRVYEILSTPEVGEPFDVDAFCAYRLPDEKNAFMHYRKVIPLFVSEREFLDSHPSVNPQDFSESASTGLEDWSRAIPAVREWVALNRKAREEWQQGADCDEAMLVSPDPTSATTSGVENPLVGLRNFSRLEGLEGMRLLSEGHPAEAWGCYRNVMRAGRHLAMHGSIMGSLVGGAVADLGVSGAVIWSGQKSVNAELLRKAIRDVEAIEKMATPPSDVIKLEYVAIREYSTRRVFGGTEMPLWLHYTGYPAQAGRTAKLVVANLLTQADRPRYLRTAVHPGTLGLYDLDPAAPPDSRLRPPDEIERSTNTSVRAVAKTLQQVAPEAATEIESCDPQLMTQSLQLAIQSNDTSQTRRSVLLLVLALQLHYREHGAFPAVLADLVKNGYLKSIPIDPFGKGEPFRYRLETGPHAAAVVWSVWVDGIDQGGHDLRSGKEDWGFRVVPPGTSAAAAR
jgi:hypothetical protein